MSDQVKRWEERVGFCLMCTDKCGPHIADDCRDCGDAARIALAAAKWRERKVHFSDMGRTTRRTKELDSYVNDMLDAILQGKGPDDA